MKNFAKLPVDDRKEVFQAVVVSMGLRSDVIEKFFGKKFTNVVYKRTPEESYNRVVRQLMKILPEADPAQIKRILR